MGFPDAVTQALTGAPDASGNMNPEAAMSNQAPPATPTPAPSATGTPSPAPTSTPPTPANVNGNAQPAAQPERQEGPGEHFRNLSHSLKGAVLAVLAGPQQAVDHYETDSTGKTVAKMRSLHPAERLQLMAQAALTGLAAGSRVPPQKSKGAAFAAGIGAGGEAQMDRAQQQDLLKRSQAAEDYERQEKAKTENAIRAMHRATTYSLWQKNLQEQNDHDPERAKNMDVVNAAQDYIQRNPGAGMSVEFVNDSQAKAIHDQEVAALKSDPTHATKLSVMLPIGMTEAKDQDGNPLFEQDGATPKQVGRIAVIKGGDKIPLPQSFVDDAKEYGTAAGIAGAGRLNEGQEVPIAQFLAMDARLNQAKNKEIDGWKNAAPGVAADGKTRVQINSFNGKTRTYPEGAIPLAVEKEQADIAEKQAGAFEKTQQGKKAQNDTVQLGEWNPPGSEGTTGADYLRTLPQERQNVLRAIAEARETRSPRQLQDKNGNPTPLAQALHRAYPDFDDKKAAAYGALVKDFTTGNTSRTLTAYGTAINHARALYDNTGRNSYIPGTDEYKRYNQDVTYVATEVAKALNPTGVATEGAISEQENALRSTFNRKAAIENAEHILTGKMSEIKQRWANGQMRPSYQPPMPGLSKEAMDSADYIRNQGQFVVADPTGKSHTFPDQASADKFKQLAGIQ